MALHDKHLSKSVQGSYPALSYKIKQTILLSCTLPLLSFSNAYAHTAFEKLAAEVAHHYPAVLAKQANKEAADANTKAAFSQFFPTPAIQLNQYQDGENVPSKIFTLSQPLWTFGRLTSGLSAARAQARASAESIADTQNSTVLRFAEVYQSTLASHGRVLAQHAGLKRLEDLNAMMRRRFNAGISARADRELSMTRLAQARSELAQEQAKCRSLHNQLEQMLGRPLSPTEIDHKPIQPQRLEALDDMISRALTNHPAVHESQATIDAARAQAKQQRAALWPTLSLQFTHQEYYRPQPGNPSNNQIFLAVQYQPGAGLSTFYQTRAAYAAVSNAQDILEENKRNIVTGLVNDIENYRMASERYIDVSHMLHSAHEVLLSYQRLFAAGKRSWIDVINAARELTYAETNMADIHSALLIGPYRIRLRMGEKVWM